MGKRVSFTRVPVGTKQRSPTRIGYREYVLTVASQLYFSNFYRLVYFFMIVSSMVCLVWTGLNDWTIPSSVVFISLEITVSALLVFEVLLRMMAYKTRFWSKWCNIFDVVALVMSLISVAMYFNEEGVLGELEEVTSDSVLALRSAVQYVRLAIFLKNRTEKISTHNSEIDFAGLDMDDHPDDEIEREKMLNAENGLGSESDDDDEHLEIAVK